MRTSVFEHNERENKRLTTSVTKNPLIRVASVNRSGIDFAHGDGSLAVAVLLCFTFYEATLV